MLKKNANNQLVFSATKRTLKKSYKVALGLLVAVVLGTAMQLIPPQIIKKIIDDCLTKKNYDGIWSLASLYLLAVAFSGISDFFREMSLAYLGQIALAEIRYDMAEHLEKLPISYFNSKPTGEILSRFTSDVDTVGTLFSQGLIGAIADLFKVLSILISLYILSPWLSIYAVMFMPIIYIISRIFRKRQYIAQLAVRKSVGNINAFISELFNGLRTIKVYGQEKLRAEAFQKPLNENFSSALKTTKYDSIFPCLMYITRTVVIAGAIIISAPASGSVLGLTVGSIAAAADLIQRLFAPIEALAMEFQTIQQAISGLHRINEFANEPIEHRNNENITAEIPADTTITLDNVKFSYIQGQHVLRGVSFSALPGKKIAIAGRTGAGKSTFIKLIAGLYAPESGTIRIGGIDPFHMPPSIRRKLIGIVPQDMLTYDGTIKEAISMHDDSISQEEIEAAAKLVGLHEDIIALPESYNTFIGEGETQLSHGQYQLLSLARAIVLNPPILLLDEVTSGLDAVTEARVYSALKQASTGRTIITISHRVSGIIDADWVNIIDNGKIVQSGTPDELAGKEGWYAVYNRLEKLGWHVDS